MALPELPALKPFQVIVMGIFAAVAVAGLVMFANFQGFSSGVAPVGTVTIWGTLPASGMNAGLQAYKQAHQEYANVSYVERPATTFDRDLAEAIATGRSPDLVLISQEDALAAGAKLVLISPETLSERDFRDFYLPIHELFLTPQGAYGVPFLVDPLVLYYNRPILASAGAVRPPATWEAVTGLVSGVNRETEARTLSRSLIALGTYDNVDNARAILSLLFLQAGYPISARTDAGMRATLLDPVGNAYGLTPAASALNFYTEFANPAKAVYSWNRSLPKSREAFVAGDVALYPGFASERAALARANPNLDFDMAPMPAPATSATRVSYGRAYAFALSRASANQEGALRVAFALAGPDAAPAFARALGVAPALRSALAPKAGDLFEPVYYPEALVARAWLSPAPEETDRIFGDMVESVLSGRESVPAAVSTANQTLEVAL